MRLFAAVSILALLTACDRHKEPEPDANQLAARALREALTFPQSTLLTVSAGTDAAEVKLTTHEPIAQVAEWYRSSLTLNGWQLRSDAKGSDGAVTIYAEKEGQPLWVTLKANQGGPGTTYTLVGAILEPDSAAPTAPQP